ncbi:MAG: flagellar assembly protein A [Planctomycetota bacterium]
MDELRQVLNVEVSEDGMSAAVEATAPCPVRLVDVPDVEAHLSEYGVTHGVQSQQIREFLIEWRARGRGVRAVVATGTPPTRGSKFRLHRLPPPARSGRRAVELLPLFVTDGEPIFETAPGHPGQPGSNVRGRPIPPPVEPWSVTPGDGIVDCGDVWRAAHSGFLVQEDARIRVARDLLHRHDLPAGEYLWDGGARIHGNLRTGVRLVVRGFLWVGGNVEDGVSLDASGDICIVGEVAGPATVVQSTGSVTVGSVSRSRIRAEGSISVGRWCRDASCRTYDHFDAATHGCRVLGGAIEAILGARLFEIGCADGGAPTRVVVGSAEWVHEESTILNAEANLLGRRLQALQNDFRARYPSWYDNPAEATKTSPNERTEVEEAYRELTSEAARVELEIGRIRSRQQRLAHMRGNSQGAAVIIDGQAHPGTTFEVRRRSLVVGAEGLQHVALVLAPKRDRVLAIPKFIFESSRDELTNAAEEPESTH